MTRKEAIEFLKNMIDRESIGFVCPKGDGDVAVWEYHVTALNMAIKALEQPEPCEDAVSRKAVEEMLKNGFPARGMWEIEGDVIKQTVCETLADALMDLGKLPSAQPEQRWIPVSNKLPEYGESVLCYFGEDEDFGLNHVIDEEAGEWFFNGVTAWMPLPGPPKEGGAE